MPTRLSTLPTIETAAKKAQAQLLKAIKQREPNKARAALHRLLQAIQSPPSTQSIHFKYVDLFEHLAEALNELKQDEFSILFDNEYIVLNKSMLKQMRDFDRLLQHLAIQLQNKKFEALNKTRQEQGMQHFFLDLKDPHHNKTGTGWNMQNGLLTILPSHFQNKTTQYEIHAHLSDDEQLGKKTWYEKPEDRDPNQAIQIYGINIKTLGKNGPNPAVDPLFIIRSKEGVLKVLCGIRRGGYALPGGMQEDKVKQTCINELLEECFSGALFEPSSITATKLNTTDIKEDEIVQFTKDILKDTPITIKQYKKANQTASDYLLEIIKQIQTSPMLKEGERAPLIAHIKCEYYKKYLPVQYQRFEEMVNKHMHNAQSVMNKSDPRNTDLAYMCTTPVELVIDEEVLTDFLKNECDLTFGAGDDLAKVQYRPIEIFAHNIIDSKEGTYSDHASLMITAIQHGIARGELVIDHHLVMQIKTIAQNNIDDTALIEQINQLSESLETTKMTKHSRLA